MNEKGGRFQGKNFRGKNFRGKTSFRDRCGAFSFSPQECQILSLLGTRLDASIYRLVDVPPYILHTPVRVDDLQKHCSVWEGLEDWTRGEVREPSRGRPERPLPLAAPQKRFPLSSESRRVRSAPPQRRRVGQQLPETSPDTGPGLGRGAPHRTGGTTPEGFPGQVENSSGNNEQSKRRKITLATEKARPEKA